MKKKWYRIANRSLSALLVLLGFQACDEINGGGQDEYGTPIVDYHVVGQVTDSEGKPIEGIRVTARGYYDVSNGSQEQIVFTDKEGRYETKSVREVSVNPQMRVVFEDVDGEANGGEFQKDSVMSADMAKARVKKGDGNWYQGEYELTASKKLNEVAK